MDKKIDSHIVKLSENDNDYDNFIKYLKMVGGKNLNDKIHVKENKNKYLNKNLNFKTN